MFTSQLLHICSNKRAHKLVMVKGIFLAGINSGNGQENALRINVKALDGDSPSFHMWLTEFNPLIEEC